MRLGFPFSQSVSDLLNTSGCTDPAKEIVREPDQLLQPLDERVPESLLLSVRPCDQQVGRDLDGRLQQG